MLLREPVSYVPVHRFARISSSPGARVFFSREGVCICVCSVFLVGLCPGFSCDTLSRKPAAGWWVCVKEENMVAAFLQLGCCGYVLPGPQLPFLARLPCAAFLWISQRRSTTGPIDKPFIEMGSEKIPISSWLSQTLPVASFHFSASVFSSSASNLLKIVFFRPFF